MGKNINISDEERKTILEMHSSFYNGFSTKSSPSKPEQLKVNDVASDKKGVTVDNKGNVKHYKNHKINEQEEPTGISIDIESMSDEEIISLNPFWSLSSDDEGGKLIIGSEKKGSGVIEKMDIFLDYLNQEGNREKFEAELESRGIRFKEPEKQDKKEDFEYSEDSYDEDVESINHIFDKDEDGDVEDIEIEDKGEEELDIGNEVSEEETCEGCDKEITEQGEATDLDEIVDGLATSERYDDLVDTINPDEFGDEFEYADKIISELSYEYMEHEQYKEIVNGLTSAIGFQLIQIFNKGKLESEPELDIVDDETYNEVNEEKRRMDEMFRRMKQY